MRSVKERTLQSPGRHRSVIDGLTIPERLLQTARTLFADKGFESTSVQDVVTTAGVTKGAMYHYFTSKEDLLYEIYARVLRLQMERLGTVIVADAPVERRLRDAAAEVTVLTIENVESVKIFFRSLHQLSTDKQATVRRERRRYHEAFRNLITEGQQTGVFRKDDAGDLAADYFFGSVHHLPMWWSPSGAKSADEVGDAFAELLLSALMLDR